MAQIRTPKRNDFVTHHDELESLLNSHTQRATPAFRNAFPEWLEFEKLAHDFLARGRVRFLGWSQRGEQRLPLLQFELGTAATDTPLLVLTAGVHGLERIGTQVVHALLNTLLELHLWDESLQNTLSRVRLIAIPMVNPFGVLHKTRGNPRGVDIMRNAPAIAPELRSTKLLGGQRITPWLPWYQGNEGELEPETEAMIAMGEREILQARHVISMDFHSGFGVVDQIWFPYSAHHQFFHHLPEMYALNAAFEKTHPHHVYKVEPGARHYTIQGDPWDYLYDRYREHSPHRDGVYLPLVMEMGSWLWLRKNPRQLLNWLGPFHPILPHRLKRVLRRHHMLIDFFLRCLQSPSVFVAEDPRVRNRFEQHAKELWYGKNV